MARERVLKVIVAGDADKLERELKRANRGLDTLGKQTRLTSSISSKGFSAMRVGATGAAAGIAGLGIATKSVVEAAIEAEKSQVKMAAQLKASGISYKEHSKEIENAIQKTSRLAALDDEDLQDAFSRIVRTTGSVNLGLKGMAVAADVARGKGVELSAAGETVAKALAGNKRALKDVGVELGDNASRTEILSALQEKYAGQAKAYGETTAGSLERAQNNFENLKETIGLKLAPTIEKAADKLGTFVAEMQDGTGQGGRFVEKLKDIWSSAKPIITGFVRAGKAVAKFTSEHPGLAKLAAGIIGVGAAVKTLKFVSAVTGFSTLLKGGRAAAKGLKSILGNAGTAAGGAAADNAASSFAAKEGKIRSVGRSVGRAAGKSLVAGVVAGTVMLLPDIKKSLEKVKFKKMDLGKLIFAPLSPQWFAEKAAGGVRALIDGIGDVMPGGAGEPGGGGGSASASGLAPAASSGLSFINRTFGGVRVSSGRRSPAENARVGGASNSDHLSGNALDLVPSGGWTPQGTALLDRIAGWARKSPMVRWIGWRGVPGHGPGDHLHLSFKGGARQPSRGGPSGTGQLSGDVVDKLQAYGGKIRGVGDVVGKGGGSVVGAFRRAVSATRAPTKAQLALWMAGIVESGLRNLDYGDRDSQGALQLRTGLHGEKLARDPFASAMAFLTRGFTGRGGAIALSRNQKLTAGQVAQAVQGSAYPGRYDAVRGQAARYLGGKSAGGQSSGGGGSSSSSSGAESSGPSQDERATGAGHRAFQSIVSPFAKGRSGGISIRPGKAPRSIKGMTGFRSAIRGARGLGTDIEDADAGYGRAERKFGQTDEDLGTKGGRDARVAEITELKKLKQQQLARQRKRAGLLKSAIAKKSAAVKTVKQKLAERTKKGFKIKGAKRVAMREDVRTYEEDILELAAELKGLGGAIQDTMLDIGDLDKDAAEVAGTADTEAEAGPEPPSATDKLGTALSDIDLQEKAGVLSLEAANAQRTAALQSALGGGFGALDQRQQWEVMAQLRDAQQAATEAQQAATQAASEVASALRDMKGSLDQSNAIATSTIGIQLREATRALGDLLGPELGGRVATRRMMPGTGQLSRL